MMTFDDVVARLDDLHALLLEERRLLEAADVGGLESLLVRKESLLGTLFTPESDAVPAPLPGGKFDADQRAVLEQRFEAIRQDNVVNGALIEAARERAKAISALVSARVPNAVYGDRGRFRGPAATGRFSRTA